MFLRSILGCVGPADKISEPSKKLDDSKEHYEKKIVMFNRFYVCLSTHIQTETNSGNFVPCSKVYSLNPFLRFALNSFKMYCIEKKMQ